MADSIVQGLFGPTAQQIQQERAATGYSQDLQAVRLDPRQQANLAIRQGGRAFGSQVMAPLFGVQDPELQKAQIAQQLASQFNTTTPEGLTQYAQALAQNGAPDLAQMAMAKVQDMQSKALSMRGTEADINYKTALTETSKTKLDVERKSREAVAALGPEATAEEVIAAVRPFGDPDTILKSLISSQDRQAVVAQRQALVDVKAYDKAKTADEKVQVVTDNADRMISVIQQSIPMVGYNTAGVAGRAAIWGSEGVDLQKNLDTLKANLGFDRLQQMRDASKTGGALGSVAVKELEALQATVASLDRTQSPEKLRESLQNIEYYYSRWRKAVKGEDPGPAVREKTAVGTAPTAPAATSAKGPRIIKLSNGVEVTVQD
ncbi:hypothetical protein UFOVP507_53 [uncultured Caudovirales phage]|uniref:Uncharacterized protein n=1 Tax=uncultured Caudovirales phage TaxID=2100421 RepID=A0A6J5MQ73_9CAUD|nr:hypothetical protein UFOVP507_53 [uncultured Caudovirales phage]